MADTDLVTLDEAREFLQKTSAQAAADDVLESLIVRASLVIQRQLDLMVMPAESDTKTLAWSGGSRVELVPFVCRSVQSVTLDDESTALTSTTYRLGPVPAVDGVYTYLEIAPTAVSSYTGDFAGPRRVTIIGQWGFDAVPDELKHACLVTVAAWYRGQVAAFSSQYEDADGGYPARTDLLPRDAFRVLDNWRRFVI